MILFAAVIVSLLNMLSHCCCVGGEKHNHKGPQTRGRINGGKGRDSAIQCFIRYIDYSTRLKVIRVYVVRMRKPCQLDSILHGMCVDKFDTTCELIVALYILPLTTRVHRGSEHLSEKARRVIIADVQVR